MLAALIGCASLANGVAILNNFKRETSSAILAGFNADPNIAVFGNTYYIYPTTDGDPGWNAKDFYVWSSKDLVQWSRSEKPILTFNQANTDPEVPKVPWANNDAWAPTIIERSGKYYFYFSGNNTAYSDDVQKTIGVAVASSPTGPFVPQAKAMIYNNEAVTATVAIDPAAFLDPVSGKYYLFWGNNKALYAELNDDMLSIKQDTLAAVAWDGTFPAENEYFEAPFMVYRDGLYHFTYSIDDTRSVNYRVGYATSSKISGPYTYHGIALQKDEAGGLLATGHQSIINVPGTSDWYICYHYYSSNGGDGTKRQVTIDVLNFNANTGLINVVKPTVGGVPAQTIP
ncbi:glycosyl hydrolase [Pseudomassariella vexata]|uniref:Glycosyl hydrolase n=1 Tax=Pseudomassariella vexata TaxID=1141098 RepID=A0A1Y2EC20_9PEZI|nr:glycosyl hydrolase [Pseudomassariella vexata]ORY69111.1 glycosyl hydrolase [Pseudomassariella vexata]